MKVDDVLQRLTITGAAALLSFDGAFVGAWFRPTTQSWFLINDRLGTLPFVWCLANGTLSFAPCAQDLDPPAKGLDQYGVVSFLTIGYCLGARTLRPDVQRLTPASVLEVPADGDQIKIDTYWDLRYRPDTKMSARDHALALHRAIDDAVSAQSPADSRSSLFLSGGWDSRGILGAQLRLERPPALVVTNGNDDSVPGTDTAMARRLASDFGLCYRFCRRQPELSFELSQEGVHRCDLATDTAPEVFGQHGLQHGFFDNVDFVFKGDEIWGWQDEAFNRESAVGQVMPTHTPGVLSQVLRPDLAADAESIHQREIDGILAESRGNTWNEHKDYLYLKGRVCRYIFGVGASDEWHAQVRRPLLAHNVIEAVSALPDRLRVQKNLFLEMLCRHEPQLYRYRRNHVGHVADYYVAMQSLVRDRSRELINQGADLEGLLDPGAALQHLESFRPQLGLKANPGFRSRVRNRLLDQWGWRWYRSDYYQHRSRSGFRTWTANDRQVVFRTWLLLEYASR